ncbi:MAG: hypothetical protein IJM31_01225 [Campylobacter sp.]|nr:hypothetical protein [Campylobacter sp.]MBR0071309.1 hypothetical protein [Campylobacter sp.]
MTIKENKKSALYTLIGAIILIVAGTLGTLNNEGGAYIFALIVGVACIGFCIAKLLSKNYMEIYDDGFMIEHSKKQMKFNFKDIEDIGIRTFHTTKNVQVLNFKFKKNFSCEDRFNFVRFYSENEATLPNIYEKSFYEICGILRNKFIEFKEKGEQI